MTCCTEHRSHPVRFLVVVALAAVAFVGQALGSPGASDNQSATTLAIAAGVGCTSER